VTHIDLDLPDAVRSLLAAALPVGGALLDGTHTMRYWYGGPGRERVAVVGPTAEQDVFRNGRDLLFWDTETRTAQRSIVSDPNLQALPLTVAAPAAMTPPQLAARVLELTGEATDTTLRSGERVADRDTYELVLRPDAAGSRIESVHIEIDGRESVPLGVQVFAVGADAPAVDASFTNVSFTAPAARNFSFRPPAGAENPAGAAFGPFARALQEVSSTGSGWLRTASYRPVPGGPAIASVLGEHLRKVSGRWGSGRLLQSPLLSVLVTDRGRLLVGAVQPAVLYRAAGS
jgi:hypothetical protein